LEGDVVPEPQSLGLILSGLRGVAFFARRFKTAWLEKTTKAALESLVVTAVPCRFPPGRPAFFK
jgi:hypothetical protein